jgi:RimJ/RimL family protein N-acetyltransferase
MSTTLFPTHVESDRLRYGPLHESVDALDLYAYHRSGEMDAVMRALGERPHATPKETLDTLTESRETWDAGERATYAIRRKADGEFLGVGELWLEWERRKASLGVWIREPFWGEGYSAERAGAMLYVAFERLDLDLVSVGHEPENEQSRRSVERYVERYGGQFDGLLRNELPPGETGGPRDLRVYTVSQSAWRDHVPAAERAAIAVRDG